MKKLRRRVSAEKVVDTAAAAAAAGAGQLHVEGQLFVGQHHKTTAGKLGLGKRSKRVVRRSSDTAIRDEVHGWSDLETQRQALESLKKAPVGGGGGGAAAGGAGAPARRGGPKRGAVRRNTVGDMHDGPRHAAPVPEGLPPPGAAPEPQKKGARPKAVRRKSTEGAIADAITQLPSRDSFLFDAPPEMDLSPDSADARLRSGSEVTADELQPDGYAGSSAGSDARGSRGQRTTGRVEQPAGAASEGGSAEPVAMRSAAEVDQAVARARERMPSDEWSEEARRTTREVLITIEPVQKKEPARTQLRQPSGGSEPQGGQTKRGRPRQKTEWTPADVPQQPSAAATSKQSSVKPTGSAPKQSGSAADEDSSDSVSDTDSEYEEPADSGGPQLRSWQPPADSQAGLRPAEPAPAGLASVAGAPPTGLEQTLQMMAERSTKLGKEKRLLGEKVSALEKERAGLLTRLEALEKEKREWEKLKGNLRDLLGAASEKAV